MFPQIFLEQTTHQCLEEDNNGGDWGIEESWNEKSDMGMRKLICFCKFLVGEFSSYTRLHTRLEQYASFPPTFFYVKFAQNLNENRLCKRHWRHGV